MTQHHERPTQFGGPPRFTTDQCFEVWKRCEPVLARFETIGHLLRHLEAAATSRQLDPVLSAVCRIDIADRWRFPGPLLAVAFTEEVCRVLDGLVLMRHVSRAEWHPIVESALEAVIAQSVFLGEEQSGRLLISRTWVLAFRATQKKTSSGLLAEAEAFAARAVLAAREHWEILKSRHMLDRILGRHSFASEALRVARDAELTGRSFDRLCRERGMSAFVARRQVRECRERAASRQDHLERLESELDERGRDQVRRQDLREERRWKKMLASEGTRDELGDDNEEDEDEDPSLLDHFDDELDDELSGEEA
jgi:hypothetical protein